MDEIWAHRYAALIWWVAVRYFTIGLEYVSGGIQTSPYWKFFGDINPTFIGWWMFGVGAVGVASRVTCFRRWNKYAAMLTRVFAIGVIIHSLFRMSIFVQARHIGDPLFVLFLCDCVAMFVVMVQLHKPRSACLR